MDIKSLDATYDNIIVAIRAYGNLLISRKQLFKFLEKFGDEKAVIYEKNYQRIKKMESLRHQTIGERKLEVVYIMGPSGSGKTTVGKYIAEQLKYDYFVSGSGEDFLDSYDKEECIILDDFRAGTMRFSEFLKFIDNNTNSSVKSRYNNKDVSNCKLIIITSVFEPAKLYKVTNVDDSDEENPNQEPLEQLMRRLKHKVYSIEGDILWCQHNDEEKVPFIDMKKVYEYFGIDLNKKDDSSLMDSLKQDVNDGNIF